MDPQGDYDSWIEIYNSNATDVDLTGLLIGNDDTVYQFSRCESALNSSSKWVQNFMGR